MNNNKDMQIAFQGILKAVMQQEQDVSKAEDLTYAILGRLNQKFPLEVSENYEKFAEKVSPKQKPQRCPKCGKQTLYSNKGVSKKSRAPYENVKCSKCGYIEWKTQTYEQHRLKDLEVKNMGERMQTDELEEEAFNNSPQYSKEY